VNLVNAGALFWLIPLAGIIILLYLLKMRRKEFKVPASFLWPNMTTEVRANSLIQKLRFSWLLVLQLLALLLVVFAFARPQIRSNNLSGQVTVIVIDGSASMSATDVKPNRLGEAVRLSKKIIDAATPGDRLSLIEAGPTPRVLSPLSNDQGKMRQALNSVEPSDTVGDVGEALRLASSLVSKDPAARIVLLSDGVFPEVQNFSPGRANLEFQHIGTSDANTAVTALGQADSSKGPQIFCGLKNYGFSDSKGVLNLYADGKLFNSFEVDVKGKSTFGQTLPAPAGAKVIEAKLDDGDHLAADNYAVSLVGASTLNVLLVGKGDLFLERALSLDPRVVLYKSESVPSTGHYDLVVFDNVPEQPVNALGVLTLGNAGQGSPVKVNGTTPKPTVKSQSDSPLLKNVALSGTFIASAQRVIAAPDAEVLVQGSDGPLLVASLGVQRHVYAAFAPLNSDFPLQVSFPIFIGNILDFLAPKETFNSNLAVPAGRMIALPAGASDLSITAPNGDSLTVPPTNGQYILRDLNTVGRYDIHSKPSRSIYVTFGDDSQSNIAPVDKLMLGGLNVASNDVTSRLLDWWKPLVLFALFVLSLEWWLFMRKS
jgi:hypothetical protein